MSSKGDHLYDHYLQYLGEPVDRQVFAAPSLPSLQVLAFAKVFPDCMTFASFGLSRLGPDSAEIIVPIDDGWDAAPEIISNVCFFCVQNKLKIGHGTLVGGLDKVAPNFVARFGKSGLYLVAPFGFPPEAESIRIGNVVININFGIFVSDEECQIIREKGTDYFETTLENSGYDPFTISRPSLVA